jgi:hypothetical protein
MDDSTPHWIRRALSSPESEIRQLARLIAAEIAALGDHSTRLLTPAEVAEHYGLSRAWVYKHAQELGGIRMGIGPRARLRFDPVDVGTALGELRPERGHAAPVESPPPRTPVELLPIGARRAPRRRRSQEAQRLAAR